MRGFEKLTYNSAQLLFQLSGHETTLDKWILSRLSYCVQQCEEGIASYTFPQSTTAIFNFWLYEFCDVYLEGVKPVLYSGKDHALFLGMRFMVRKIVFF